MADFDPNEILRQVLDRAFLLRVGQETIRLIQERTLRGEFLEGSTTHGYSTKPAGMPYGGLQERVGKGKAAEIFNALKKGKEAGIWRSSKSGKIWLRIQGGYKRLRELTGREVDRVTLNWSGQMLSALNVIEVNEAERSVTIRFRNQRAGEIAGFHHAGAGKNKVKRIFVGLSERELQEMVGRIA